MTNYAYLTTRIISDEGSSFVTEVTKEVGEVPELTLEHGTTKHAQAMGKPEGTHVSLEKALKQANKRRSVWHKYVNIAFLNYHTTYHTSIG